MTKTKIKKVIPVSRNYYNDIQDKINALTNESNLEKSFQAP